MSCDCICICIKSHLAVVCVLDCFVVVDQIRVVPVGEQLLLPPVVVHLVVQRVLVVHRVGLGQAGGCKNMEIRIFVIPGKEFGFVIHQILVIH